jgi:hypothetical protein
VQSREHGTRPALVAKRHYLIHGLDVIILMGHRTTSPDTSSLQRKSKDSAFAGSHTQEKRNRSPMLFSTPVLNQE